MKDSITSYTNVGKSGLFVRFINLGITLLRFYSLHWAWTSLINFGLTASSDPEAMSSCNARTERACSMTNTHCDKSGGLFWKIKVWILDSELFYLAIICNKNVSPCRQCFQGDIVCCQTLLQRGLHALLYLCRTGTPYLPKFWKSRIKKYCKLKALGIF